MVISTLNEWPMWVQLINGLGLILLIYFYSIGLIFSIKKLYVLIKKMRYLRISMWFLFLTLGIFWLNIR